MQLSYILCDELKIGQDKIYEIAEVDTKDLELLTTLYILKKYPIG